MMAIFWKVTVIVEVHLRGSAKSIWKVLPKRIRINLSSQARLLFLTQ
jgi:hypothetical protein